ncbi:MAG: hypothetical protein M1438_12825 [Deltaproteobacteria bacterium]|nr:hypothetical protein [Deltaproteobacteria bacterium]
MPLPGDGAEAGSGAARETSDLRPGNGGSTFPGLDTLWLLGQVGFICIFETFVKIEEQPPPAVYGRRGRLLSILMRPAGLLAGIFAEASSLSVPLNLFGISLKNLKISVSDRVPA